MRIVAGKQKGIRVNAPKKLPVRPTTDMAKEALFNILNNDYYFDEISVLDLFSGIGSISLEFASRGTKDITSVDKHRGCSRFVASVAEEHDMPIQIINMDAYKFLEQQSKKFDVIFADPPYDFTDDQFAKIVTLVFDKKLLNENGVLIIEHSKKTDLATQVNFKKNKKYGGNCFSFFSEVPFNEA